MSFQSPQNIPPRHNGTGSNMKNSKFTEENTYNTIHESRLGKRVAQSPPLQDGKKLCISDNMITTAENPFVIIIKKMLLEESQQKYRTTDNRFPVIGWSDDGRYLMIRNPQTLFSKMMADFFVTTNLQSFVRQLNHYNFVKIKTSNPSLNSKRQQDETLVYEHAKFNRDNQCDLERKQKLYSRRSSNSGSNGSRDCNCYGHDVSNFVSRDEYDKILTEHKVLWNVIHRQEDELKKIAYFKMEMELQIDWLKDVLDKSRSVNSNGNGSTDS